MLIEFSLRMYFAVSNNAYRVLVNPRELVFSYYKNLSQFNELNIDKNDEKLDILLLGGSVLHKYWGDVESSLIEELNKDLNCNFKIYNLSFPAHTSLDSRNKLNFLEDQNFDIVVLYHGINELRFNNCPKEMFDSSYNHVGFYREISPLMSSISNFTIMPFAFNFITVRIDNFKSQPKYLSTQSPRSEWTHYGREIRTYNSFKSNLTYTIDYANTIGAKLIVPEFAYYITDNYSQESFENGLLDYSDNRCPIELWGEKENVEIGLNLSNKLIRELNSDPTLKGKMYSIDLPSAIPKSKLYYNDICHFTRSGSEIFAKEISLKIQDYCQLEK